MTSFWERLFGRSRRAAAVDAQATAGRVEAVLAEIEARSRPCLRLVPGGGGRSRLGGLPEMAGPWPRYEGRPLSLVAQLDLAEMRTAGGPDWLPDAGRLLFFYELEHGSWGFDPKDAGSAVVLYEPDAAEPAPEPEDLPADGRFEPYPVTFVADVSRPSDERLAFDWHALTAREQADLEAAVEAFTPEAPAHQAGGYPGPIQSDQMELDCQRVTSGLYLGKGAPRNAGANERDAGAADWRLLLQIDTDEEAGMMWCDTGRLYYWIREQDARAGDFSKTWTILQCY